MKKLKQLGLQLSLVTLVLGLGACSTVTLKEKGISKLSTEPNYEASKPYYLWGLVGENHIDAGKICGGKGVKQIQATDTFVDGLLTVLTLGIYRPRTAKVWCS